MTARIIFLTAVLTMFHVSLQKDITTTRYRRLTTDSELNDTKVTHLGHEILNKTIANDNELADKLFIPVITEKCERMGICEDVPNYPEEHVRAIVEAARMDPSRFQYRLFHFKTLYEDSFSFSPTPTPLGKADSREINYENLCDADKKPIMPQAAKNVHNEWQIIVNPKKEPIQTFNVEVCRSLRAPCSNVVTVPINYHAWCEQKHIWINMVAINKRGRLIEEPHKLASCCSCVFRRN